MQKSCSKEFPDNSSLWISAATNENIGNLEESFRLYLLNSIEQVKKDSLINAGLSCACAAKCSQKMNLNQISKKLCSEAGKIYEEYSKEILSKSIRESLWSLLAAYEFYLLADDIQRANPLEEKFVNLKQRLNPFYGEKEAITLLRERKNNTPDFSCEIDRRSCISKETIDVLEEFLKLRKTDPTELLSGLKTCMEKKCID